MTIFHINKLNTNNTTVTIKMKLTSALVITLMSCMVQAEKKVTITRFEDCDANADYPVKITFKLKEENGVQILEEGGFTSKIPLGRDIKDIAEVYTKEGNEYEHLITINENLCDAVNKYMGDFMHDMQQAAGLERGACPVPAGDYKIKDHALDFSKFKFKKIPEGDFRVKVTLVDPNNTTLHCHFLEFTIA